MKCPVEMCTKTFTCQEMDPESLPDAAVVFHRQDVQQLKKKLKRDELICSICFDKDRNKEVRSVASCDHCGYICQSCKSQHETLNKYSDHEVMLFLELSLQDDSMHFEMLRRTRTFSFVQQTRNKCKIHPQKPNISFCLDCNTYVCSVCINATHIGHKCKACSEAMSQCVEILKNRISPIKLARNHLLEAAKNVEKRKSNVKDQRLTLSSSIDDTFDRLSKIFSRRKEEMKAKVNSLAECKINKLSIQQVELEKQAKELERMVEFTERVLSSSTQREFLSVYPFLHDTTKMAGEPVPEPMLQPVETANITLKSSSQKNIRDLCRRDLDIYLDQASPGTCSVEGEGIRSAQTMHNSQFVVNVVDKHHRPCSSTQDIAVRVKCCDNLSEVTALVSDRGASRYRVSFCPEFRGKHEVHVSVNNNQITGSPFSLRVHMPPEQLGSSQGSIVDVTQPRGIVFTPDEDTMLICEWNGNRVVEMDRIGRRSRTLSGPEISHPASLALSPFGDIFVVEGLGANMGVVKWDGHGKLLTSACGKGTEPGSFRSPRGIKLGPTSEEVFVCDRDNGRLQVFDLELNHLRCINLGEFDRNFEHSKPNDLAFDRRGNMFITDYALNCIHHLSPEEKYCRSFSTTKKGPLAGPESIVIDDSDILYVTESHNHRVSVFLTSGECVRVFGCKGKGEGEFNFPMGIAVDTNGNIFVCELLNNRIQVF